MLSQETGFADEQSWCFSRFLCWQAYRSSCTWNSLLITCKFCSETRKASSIYSKLHTFTELPTSRAKAVYKARHKQSRNFWKAKAPQSQHPKAKAPQSQHPKAKAPQSQNPKAKAAKAEPDEMLMWLAGDRKISVCPLIINQDFSSPLAGRLTPLAHTILITLI